MVEAGRPDRVAGAPINEAIELSSTFIAGGERNYAREGTRSTAAFEAAIGALEGGTATAFSSGMAATTAIVEGLAVGSAAVIPQTFYNLGRTLFDEQVRLGRLEIRPVDTTDTAATIAALDGASLLWLELPSNPTLRVADLPALTAAAGERSVRTVVDSTLATPLGIRPLSHGADVVLHSATKWIAGHGDLIMGLLITADPDQAVAIRTRRTLTGAIPGSVESFLALRGLRTLAVRLERCSANAATLAQRLADHPAITSVNYPGRPDHPDADRVASLLDNHGGLLSFTTDTVERADALCRAVRLISHATSLGGVESLIERRGRYPGEIAQGSPAELVRMSVGIEHIEDLWSDLERGLR